MVVKRAGKRVYRKRGVAKRGAGKRVYRKRQLTSVRNYAKVVEDLPGEIALNTGSVYSIKNFQLNSCARAAAVAQGFQHYRISKVELFVKPNQDTYSADTTAIGPTSGGGFGIPYMYYKVDRMASFPPTGNLGTLKRMGTKPLRIDDKVIPIRFKPNVIVGATDNPPGGTGLVSELSAFARVSPWLTTNANSGSATSGWAASSVDHYGIVFGADAQRQPSSYPCASVQIRLTFEFKDPLWNAAASLDGIEHPPINHIDTLTLRTANIDV